MKNFIVHLLAALTVALMAYSLFLTYRIGKLEGREQTFAGLSELADHACGPYEQPVHPNFKKTS